MNALFPLSNIEDEVIVKRVTIDNNKDSNDIERSSLQTKLEDHSIIGPQTQVQKRVSFLLLQFVTFLLSLNFKNSFNSFLIVNP